MILSFEIYHAKFGSGLVEFSSNPIYLLYDINLIQIFHFESCLIMNTENYHNGTLAEFEIKMKSNMLINQ